MFWLHQYSKLFQLKIDHSCIIIATISQDTKKIERQNKQKSNKKSKAPNSYTLTWSEENPETLCYFSKV
jgi:hypothetical protein